MEIAFLKSLVIIFGISAAVVYALGRLKVPSIVGFLVAGVILGPHGFGFIRDVHEVEVMAEMGVVLLMFTIGLEFSLQRLASLRKTILLGGTLQVGLTILAVAVLSSLVLRQSAGSAVFDGFLVALSSTAIAIKLLADRGEMSAPFGRTSVGILIFQDLCVVPFMLLVPVLAGTGGSAGDILLTMGKAGLVIAIVFMSARWGVPHLLHQVVHTRSRELFVITIILLCVGTALLTAELGLSLALGAFLAGIVISESEYASQAIADILPFKESFTGLFFISVGMLMDLSFLAANAMPVMAAVTVIGLLKTATAGLSAVLIGQSVRNALMTGFYISQIGEFSFVLAVAGKAHGLFTEDIYQTFLSASVLTMLMTPFLIAASGAIAGRLLSMGVLRRFDRSMKGADEERFPKRMSDHVIVIGFGVNGRNLARVLKASGIHYVILELNSSTVRKMKGKGEPIYYGDATSAEILHKLRINAAKQLVVAISDAAATRRIVQIARHESPNLHILVRTRYVTEVDDLIAMGASEVIPEEFETSIEIFARVLHQYHIPRNVINDHIEEIRSGSYQLLRSVDLPRKALPEYHDMLKELESERFLVKTGGISSGRTMKELRLRTETGATLIAVQRGGSVHTTPPADFTLREGDVLLLVGTGESLTKAVAYLEICPLPQGRRRKL